MPDYSPQPILQPRSAAKAKRRIGQRLHDGLNRSNPFSLFATSLILGMLVLFASILVGIDEITITHNGITKEVGLFYTPNWTIVYLILFPLYLVMLSRQASYVQTIIEEMVESRCIVADDGEAVQKEILISCLEADFTSASNALLLLAAVTAFVALGGWYTSCYIPLHNWSTGSQVVSWCTAPIEDPTRRSDQTILIIYSFAAYCWMGAALFVYISCLFANIIYAVFVYKIASGICVVDGQKLRLVSRTALPKLLSEYLYNFLVSGLLGFAAAFLMQLESQYLLSDKTNISQFWFGDIDVLKGWKMALFDNIASPIGHFQVERTKNQTLFTSLAVLAATLAALGAGVWFIQATLRAARAYTASIASRADFLAKIGLTMGRSDMAKLERRDELSAVFPTIKTATILCAGIIFCTLFPRFGILFSSIILVAVWRYLVKRLTKITHVQ